MGKRPCSSGIRSDGLETWNAPAATKRMWSVRTMPYLVLTVVPSTIGRMSRCTPSRLTSGPWPPSRPATLSISSMKMMPACWTRSTAARATLSMSTSFCSSSCVERARALRGLRTRRFLRPALKQPRQHVLDVDVDFLDRRAGDDLERREASSRGRRSRPVCDRAVPRAAARAAFRACDAPVRAIAAACSSNSAAGGSGGSSRSSTRSSAALRAFSRHSGEPLLAHQLHGDLGQVADHRFDVAADVADLGELRRFDLEERRLRELRQPPRDLGLADAGRADHQDVLRRDFFGHLRRQLLSAHAVAQRDRDGALGLVLADDVLVELGDDLPRRERFDGRGGRFGKVDRHGDATERFDRERVVGVDADRRGDVHGLLRDRARVERRVTRERLAPRPARTAPPDPIATIPSSGSMRSPVPDSRYVCSASITISIASSRRSMRSVRQSFASSTADRSRLPRYCSSLASNREKSANESAAEPAKPARMRSL